MWLDGKVGQWELMIYLWTHIIANCNCCCMDLTSLCLKRFDTDDHRDICDTVPAKTRIVMMFLLVLLMIIFVEKYEIEASCGLHASRIRPIHSISALRSCHTIVNKKLLSSLSLYCYRSHHHLYCLYHH